MIPAFKLHKGLTNKSLETSTDNYNLLFDN